MFPTDVVIVSGARTPMARYTGAFKDISAIELGAIASREAIRRSGAERGEFDHVVFGNVMQTSADAIFGARHVGLKAGLKIETPAVTVNRLCGSGIESIAQAAQRIMLGEASVVLAGGMENMTQAPHVIRGARTGFRLGEGKLEDSLMVGLLDSYSGCTMSDTAENLAIESGITRKASDEYALRSQQLAEAAHVAGIFNEEIVPVEVKKGRQTELFSADDHRRPETTYEALTKLAAGISQRWNRDRGKRQRNCRRCGCGSGGEREESESAWLETAGQDYFLRGRRSRSAHHGNRSRARIAKSSRCCGTETRSNRSHRSERSICATISRGGKSTGNKSRQGQREWRRDRVRTSAGRDRNAASSDIASGIAATRIALWSCDSMHRRRPGYCHDCGSDEVNAKRSLIENMLRHENRERVRWRLKRSAWWDAG